MAPNCPNYLNVGGGGGEKWWGLTGQQHPKFVRQTWDQRLKELTLLLKPSKCSGFPLKPSLEYSVLSLVSLVTNVHPESACQKSYLIRSSLCGEESVIFTCLLIAPLPPIHIEIYIITATTHYFFDCARWFAVQRL